MSTINVRGGSTSSLAEVDNNALRTRRNSEWDVALDAGLAFSWSNATFNYAAIDTVIAVQNNSAVYDLKIRKIIISGDTATQFVVHRSSGITLNNAGAGAAIVAVNLNGASSQLGTGLYTAVSDDDGNSQSTAYLGRLITGRIAANGLVEINVDGAIILPNGKDIGIDFTTVGTACNCTILGYYVLR